MYIKKCADYLTTESYIEGMRVEKYITRRRLPNCHLKCFQSQPDPFRGVGIAQNVICLTLLKRSAVVHRPLCCVEAIDLLLEGREGHYGSPFVFAYDRLERLDDGSQARLGTINRAHHVPLKVRVREPKAAPLVISTDLLRVCHMLVWAKIFIFHSRWYKDDIFECKRVRLSLLLSPHDVYHICCGRVIIGEPTNWPHTRILSDAHRR